MKRRSRGASGPVKPRRRTTAAFTRREASKTTCRDNPSAAVQMELRTSEERWQSLLNNPIFGVTFLDENQQFIKASRTFQNMVGYSDEELRQLTPLYYGPVSVKSMKTSSAKCDRASDNIMK